jgi:hypothetical protein
VAVAKAGVLRDEGEAIMTDRGVAIVTGEPRGPALLVAKALLADGLETHPSRSRARLIRCRIRLDAPPADATKSRAWAAASTLVQAGSGKPKKARFMPGHLINADGNSTAGYQPDLEW